MVHGRFGSQFLSALTRKRPIAVDRAARSATSLPFVTSVHQKRFRVPYQKLRRLYPSVSKSKPLGETGDVTTAPPFSPELDDPLLSRTDDRHIVL